MTPKHQKITTYNKQIDGSIKIEHKSYYESLAQIVQEIEKHQLSSKETLKEDVNKLINQLLLKDIQKLIITITPRSEGGFKVTQRYIEFKQKF